jgi:hypothetical protein
MQFCTYSRSQQRRCVLVWLSSFEDAALCCHHIRLMREERLLGIRNENFELGLTVSQLR